MVAKSRKDWREKEAELLALLEQRLPEQHFEWLQESIKLDAPDLELAITAELPVHFPGGKDEPPPAINDSYLIRTFIWQCWVKIAAGLYDPVRGNIRSFWYQSLEGFYLHHDLLPREAATRWRDDDNGPAARIIERMTEYFAQFVRRRIFWYRDQFRFQEPIESKKKRGVHRPGILFFTEKEGLWWLAEQLYKAPKASVSVMASNGQVSLLNMEYFAVDLSKKTWKLSIGAMCDLDPWGYAIAGALDEKLRFLLTALAEEKAQQTGGSVPTVEVTTWLLTDASLFTAAQIAKARDYSAYLVDPLPGEKPKKSVRTLVRNWFERTGGVNGKPLALHVDVVDDELKEKRAHKQFVKVLLDGKKPNFPTIDPAHFLKLRDLLAEEKVMDDRARPDEQLADLRGLLLG